ncbi:MAG: hypothetical protein IT245_04745, partial [Bacteroidia bacterium]|nr:hypothetical protein [Bacteroidia bacterium]
GFVIPEIGLLAQKVSNDSIVIAQRASSWGWSTWKSRWNKAVWDSNYIFENFKANHALYNKTSGDKLRMLVRELGGRNSSWAIIWDYNHFMNHAYCIYPTHSLIRNIGLDNSGTHSKPLKYYEVDEFSGKEIRLPSVLLPNTKIDALFSKINRKPHRWLLDKFKLWRLFSNFNKN